MAQCGTGFTRISKQQAGQACRQPTAHLLAPAGLPCTWQPPAALSPSSPPQRLLQPGMGCHSQHSRWGGDPHHRAPLAPCVLQNSCVMPARLHTRLPAHAPHFTHHGAGSCQHLLPWQPSGAGWHAAAHRTDPGPACAEEQSQVNMSVSTGSAVSAGAGMPRGVETAAAWRSSGVAAAAAAWRRQRQPAKPHLAALGGER